MSTHPGVAAVLRQGPLPDAMVPSTHPYVKDFNSDCGYGHGLSRQEALSVMRALRKAVCTKWEVVRVLRSGWDVV